MSNPLNTLTVAELTTSFALLKPPARSLDYGAHPPRPPYPGRVLPDIQATESQDTGPQGAIVRRLRARIVELEAERDAVMAELARREGLR